MKKCFVMMPFAPELHYFYLYLKQHIEKKHALVCERGDDQVLTKSILEKINQYIDEADVILADCTGRNPNVFYELGLAHAHDKKVILITQDKIEEAPADVRHFDFIRYGLNDHVSFFNRLDNALRNVLGEQYKEWYERAKLVFKEFQQATQAQVNLATQEVFIDRLVAAAQIKDLPALDDKATVRKLVLLKIVAEINDEEVLTKIADWLAAQDPIP
jgi:nucleoside 2-deoxyribosyltransferase